MKKILIVFVLFLMVSPIFAATCIQKNGDIVCYDSSPDNSVKLLVEAYKEREKTEDLLKSLQEQGDLTTEETKIIKEIAFSDNFGFSIEGYTERESFEDNIIFLKTLNNKLRYALNRYRVHEKEIELQIQPDFDHGSLKDPIFRKPNLHLEDVMPIFSLIQ